MTISWTSNRVTKTFSPAKFLTRRWRPQRVQQQVRLCHLSGLLPLAFCSRVAAMTTSRHGNMTKEQRSLIGGQVSKNDVTRAGAAKSTVSASKKKRTAGRTAKLKSSLWYQGAVRSI